MKQQRIFLTGGNGMVGRNFLEHPAASNFEIFSPSSAELDLCDYSAVHAQLKSFKPDIIIHAAGKVGGIQANIRNPVSFLLENLDIGRNIVWASYQAKIKRLINLGSSCMYPRGNNHALYESQILQGELEPTNEGYALSKIVISRLCSYISNSDRSYQYKTLIPCNLYGRYDKFRQEDSHLIPAVIHKIHQAKSSGDKSVSIWGDGTVKREFMYAGDFADALVYAIDHFDTLPLTMNIGMGDDHTINEYYRVIADVIGYDVEFKYDVAKPTGMQRKLVSTELQDMWGWHAKYSLRQGVDKTYAFYLEEYC